MVLKEANPSTTGVRWLGSSTTFTWNYSTSLLFSSVSLLTAQFLLCGSIPCCLLLSSVLFLLLFSLSVLCFLPCHLLLSTFLFKFVFPAVSCIFRMTFVICTVPSFCFLVPGFLYNYFFCLSFGWSFCSWISSLFALVLIRSLNAWCKTDKFTKSRLRTPFEVESLLRGMSSLCVLHCTGQ